MDIFLEYIVMRKKTGTDYAIVAGGIVLTLILSFLAFGALPRGMQSFSLIIVAGLFFLCYQLISSRNLEFEYIFVNGSLDVDKIIARKKRKRVSSVEIKEVEIIAPLLSPHDKHYQSVSKVIDASGSEEKYFIVYSEKGVRTKLIISPPDRLLEAFRMVAPRAIQK